MISTNPVRDGVPLVRGGIATNVYIDKDDADVVRIAAEDFCEDVYRVTDEQPELVTSSSNLSGSAVIIGTLGESDGVDACVANCDISEDVEKLSDESECFVIQTVETPLPGVRSAVLIIGSDRRGTAFGVYELSKQIGVSPWYWWADVAPDSQETIVVESGSYRYGPPSVTYRGIFLNDEDFGLRPWASETFAPEEAADRPGLGPKTYAKIFELLLRLKANTIWTAMHPNTKAFYRYPENAEVADKYAIVVGTSHCEPMHRNNVDEWEDAFGEWNYATNGDRIREYWRERVEDVANDENIFTIGMRGIHDSGMPGGDSRDGQVELLQQVLDDQREMLDEVHDRQVDAVPQVFCLYKEVLDLYRGELDIPEDVCLMWPNDSHGYLRELPTEMERERVGGSGIYYHLSYWGRPHDYLWLSSIPLGLIKAEMGKAYDAGAQEFWIVNVGDIKPTEKEMEFFLNLAWDIDAVRSESASRWLEDWATREFGAAHAGATAEILAEYYRLSLARKPEHMGWSTVYPNTEPDDPAFSLTHGDEARRRIEAFEQLIDRAEEIYEALSEDRQPAFYELVLYQVRCAGAMSEKFLHAARSRLYAGQGRTTANRYAELTERARTRIAADTRYYNEELVGGKWEGMMSDHPRDLPAFDVPGTARYDPTTDAAFGVSIEGRRAPIRSDEVQPPSLPTFHRHVDRNRFIDVYTRGTDPIEWSATASDEWIRLPEWSGTISDERRLQVSIDWDTVPDGRTSSEVVIESQGVRKTVGVKTVNPTDDPAGDFVEANGVVAIEAEQYSRAVDGSVGTWERCDVPGRVSGETIAVQPSLFSSYLPESDNAPRLEYDIDLTTAGSVEIEVQCIPTQALNARRDLRYAVELDGEKRRTVSIDPEGGEHDPEWQRNVLRGTAIGVTRHRVDQPRKHTLRLSALDPGLIVDRIIIYTDGERMTYLGPRETAVESTPRTICDQ